MTITEQGVLQSKVWPYNGKSRVVVDAHGTVVHEGDIVETTAATAWLRKGERVRAVASGTDAKGIYYEDGEQSRSAISSEQFVVVEDQSEASAKLSLAQARHRLAQAQKLVAHWEQQRDEAEREIARLSQ